MIFEDPLNYLKQIKWFLDNLKFEQFPGAFVIAAGHLCRCVVEQEYLIVGALANLPANKILDTSRDRRLKPMLEIRRTFNDPPSPSSSYRNCWEAARARGPRAKKHADLRQRLERWAKIFNEPSHSSPPTHVRSVTQADIKAFHKYMLNILDEKDKDLFIGAYNQLLSNGKYRIDFENDADNTPCIFRKLVLTLDNIEIKPDKSISIVSPKFPLQVVQRDKEPQNYDPGALIIIQNSTPTLRWQFIDDNNKPVDLTNFGTILKSLCGRDPHKLEKLIKIFEAGGYSVKVIGDVKTAEERD
jgi:hypothetical protein